MHGIYHGGYRPYREWTRPSPRFVRHDHPRPLSSELLPPPKRRSAVNPLRSLRSLLKSAVIGVSCAAFPGGCPAILALGRIGDLLSTAKGIVRRVRASSQLPPSERHSLAGFLAAEVVGHIVGPLTRSVTNEIVERIPATGVGSEGVRAIVSGTVSDIMTEGFSGLAGWEMSGI